METLYSRNWNGHLKGHEPKTAPLLEADIICGLMRTIAAVAMLRYSPACLPGESLH